MGKRGRKPIDDGVRFSVYFHKEQLEWLDAECEKQKVSRTKYIEMHCLPKSMQCLKNKKHFEGGTK